MGKFDKLSLETTLSNEADKDRKERVELFLFQEGVFYFKLITIAVFENYHGLIFFFLLSLKKGMI
jgi:hypothetical protein